MRRIILASQSPRRKEILALTGLTFEVEPSNYEENMELNMPPNELAKHLSLGKALNVAQRYPNAIIIAADTFVSIDGILLGKPHTAEKAKETLKRLSGKSHVVITGFAIIDTVQDCQISQSVETKVHFRNLSEDEIDAYIKSGEPLDKAGAYGIQGLAALFVEKIEGDYFNIMGMPLISVAQELKSLGVKIL